MCDNVCRGGGGGNMHMDWFVLARCALIHGEQETLASRTFTASFIFGVDYTSTIYKHQVVLVVVGCSVATTVVTMSACVESVGTSAPDTLVRQVPSVPTGYSREGAEDPEVIRAVA